MKKSRTDSGLCNWVLLLASVTAWTANSAPMGPWQVGTPIVTYWCGPALTDAVATQMAEGGWNLVWCGEKEMDLAQRHGLRAQLTDGLLTPASLDDPKQREKLEALIARVRTHPALYAYFITDEPSAAQFPALGRLVAFLRERDPAHLAYINLFPTYASNAQLGNKGDATTGSGSLRGLRHQIARRFGGRIIMCAQRVVLDDLWRSRICDPHVVSTACAFESPR